MANTSPAENDDDDAAAMWRAYKDASQEKRAANRQDSAQILANQGIPYISHNGGVHLVVCGLWNFWPGTGKYMEIRGSRQGRGVFNLIALIDRGATLKGRQE